MHPACECLRGVHYQEGVLSYCKETKAGPRLRYNVPCGYRLDWLSDRLGFDTDNGAEE